MTEGGYHVNQVTGEFDPAGAALEADLAGGGPPQSVFGFITEAARMRRDAGIPPFTVMSCDNLPGNGDVAKKMILAFAAMKDAELADYMRANIPSQLHGRPDHPGHRARGYRRSRRTLRRG